MFEKELAEQKRRCDHLLRVIQHNLPAIDHVLQDMNGDYEDRLYRYYHHSFKVYSLQKHTERAVELFRKIGAEVGCELNEDFMAIVHTGTRHAFEPSHNREWAVRGRPIIEAFLHARYFAEMMATYGRELKASPDVMPSGWAAVLYLFNLR